MEQIWGYAALVDSIESIRRISYDSNNKEHEAKLLSLWNILQPSEPLVERISKQWQDIGFQGMKNNSYCVTKRRILSCIFRESKSCIRPNQKE